MPDIPQPNTLSPIRVEHGLVFTSGQVGIDPRTGYAPSGFGEQFELALENLGYALSLAGAGLPDVLKTTIYLVRRDCFPAMEARYRERFSDPYPARSTVICELVRPNLLVEIEAVARTVQAAADPSGASPPA
jgi:2-iminobutanoate/2-iminopropanoate deaminase